MSDEAIAKYKYYMCRKILEQLLCDGLINEQQLKKIEKAVVRRLSLQV